MARDERVYEMMKVKMETTIMYELADAPDEGYTNTKSIICTFNSEFTSPPCNDSLKMDEIMGEIILEKTVEMAKWNLRSGRKGKGHSQSAEGKLIE